MRSEKVLKNSFWSLSSNLINIIFGFISKTVFIWFLNEQYLGINGLFTSVLSLLSLTELGFSSAVTFNLYKPLRDRKEEKIAAIMNFYKFVYRIVACVILLVGLTIVPFLNYIVKESQFDISYIRIVYIIFLLNTVSTYLYSYNYTLASADQKEYYTTRFNVIIIPTVQLAKIIMLVITRNFIAYLITEIVLNFIFNIVKAEYVRRRYPVLNNKEAKLNRKERRKLLTDVKNIFIGKVSTTILTSTDNIVISTFVNVVTVGLVSNYNMIIGYIQGFVNTTLYSAQASIGNVIATESKEYAWSIMNKITLITSFIASFCCISLYCLSSDFIQILWSTKYVMEHSVIAVLIFSTYMQMTKSTLWMTLGVCGFFERDKYISMIGAISNLIVSIILVKFIGVVGVFLGTIISQGIQFVLKNHLLSKRYFMKSSWEYMSLMIKCYFVFILEWTITVITCNIIAVQNIYIKFIAKCIVCLIIPNVITFFIYNKTEAFGYMVSLIQRVLHKRKEAMS